VSILFKDYFIVNNMEDSEAQTKTFTLPLDLIQGSDYANYEQLCDRLSEIVLEFYEDGKYSYSEYKLSNKKIPDTHRQVKTRIKKFLHKFDDNKTLGSKVLNSFFVYMCEMDESLMTKLKTKNRSFIKENKDLKSEVQSLKALNDELQNNMDQKVQDMLDTEVCSLLADTMEEERQNHRVSMKKRYDIIGRQDEEIEKLKQYIESGNQQTTNEKAGLIEELHNAKEELKKYKEGGTGNPGRPKLNKKEKKRRKLAKLKKQMESLQSSSSSDSDSESD